MSYIEVKNLTKDYKNNNGIFDVSLSIEKGVTFGFVGANGAGKTTTIRHLMGYIKPDSGSAKINNLDCWFNADKIKKLVGYVPGEIAFPNLKSGWDFLKQHANLIGSKDLSYAKRLVERLQFDASANLKRMSKGMKQKTAIVAALMNQPDILILDEPTTGLDPLMREELIKILKEQKNQAKTIFISSHVFEELEDTCDYVALIKEGRIIVIKFLKEIKHIKNKTFKIEFENFNEYLNFLNEKFNVKQNKEELNQVIISIEDKDINRLTKSLKNYQIKFISEIKFSLEDFFISQYTGTNIGEN